MPASDFLVVDWGSTHLRLYLLSDRDPSRWDEFRSERGIRALQPGQHQDVFLEALRELLRLHPADLSGATLEVYFSGMITSTLGWVQTPYLRVPVSLNDLIAGLLPVELPGSILQAAGGPARLSLRFFPGVRSAADVLRGEEVEVFGIIPESDVAAEWVVVLPGTHCKWILFQDGRIADFVTVPTGDVHAALHRETLLSRTLPEKPVAVGEDLLPCFERGVRAAEKDGPLSSLFKARALGVLEDHRLKPEEVSAFLSGVLIGGEVLERLARLERRAKPACLLLGGEAGLRRLYVHALALVGAGGFEVRESRQVSSAVEGIRRIRQAIQRG